MPDTSAPNPGENQDRDSAKRKEPPRSPTEPATSPREESHTPGEDQEEAAQPKPNPSEGTSPPEEPASPRATVEVNVGEPNPDPVSPGANQEQRKPEDAANQSAGAREETEPKEKETSWWKLLVETALHVLGPLQERPQDSPRRSTRSQITTSQ